MSARGSHVAWTTWALALALVVAAIVLYVLHESGSRRGPEATLFVMLGVPTLAYASVGAAITSKLPRNRVGWLFLAVGLTFALTAFSGSYAQAGIVLSPGSLPAARFMAWLFVLAPVVALPMALPLLFLLFPTGRLLSRRWIPAAAAAVASLLAFGVLARPSLVGNVQLRLEGLAWARGLDGHGRAPAVGIVLIVGASIAAVASVVVRYRHAAGEERQQLRALAYLLGALAATLPFPLLLGWFGLFVVFVVVGLSVLIGIPIASAISILGYRLYDIELKVKKTVTAGLLVGIISLAYAFVAVLLGRMLGGFDLRYLLPAVPIALAFQPLRARTRRWAERLVYGERATPYEVLSEFSERASGTHSTEDVLPRMVQLVAAGTGATDVRVWLRVGRELRVAAPLVSGGDREIVAMPGDDLPAFDADEVA